MQKFDILFVVLCYKNTEDLRDFILSVRNVTGKTHIIIVDAFYDKKTSLIFDEIASQNNLDIIHIPNNGYGFGNNAGIEYALKNYSFRFLAVSNPDIEIQSIDSIIEMKPREAVYAPQILNPAGKNVNPWRVRNFNFLEKMKYEAILAKNIDRLKMIHRFEGLLNKIPKKLIHLNIKSNRVYSAHGSFMIFDYETLKKVNEVFDSNIFLFCEEEDLSNTLKLYDIPIYYIGSSSVYHKEDGSINVSNVNVGEQYEKSYIYYYEKWRKEK